MSIKVLIVDDSATMRALLQARLSSEPDIEVVGSACNAAEGRELIKLLDPDVVTLDIEMPGMDGLTVIQEARRLNADLSVIIIAGFSTEASAIEAANIGVSGYLTKPFKVPKVLAVAARALGE